MKVNRQNLVQKILNSKGKFFSVTFKTKEGKERMLNAKLPSRRENRVNEDKIYGYITVLDRNAKGMRCKRVNTRTISKVRIGGDIYTI